MTTLYLYAGSVPLEAAAAHTLKRCCPAGGAADGWAAGSMGLCSGCAAVPPPSVALLIAALIDYCVQMQA